MVALLTADSFNRTNNASSLGSTDGAGTLDPIAWNPEAGTWGITSNAGYCPTNTVRGLATIDTGHANVDVSMKFPSSGGTDGYGFAFRISDTSNYWFIQGSAGGTISLVKRVAGSNTTVGTSITTFTNNDVIKVKAINNVITVYKNGTAVGRFIDSFNRSATKVGMWNGGALGYQFEDFAVYSVDVPTELSTDSFNRIDSSVLGNTDGVGSLDPLTWVGEGGSSFLSDIVSNAAALGGSATIAINPTGLTWTGNNDYIDVGTGDVTIHLKWPGSSVAILFRYVDSNNYWMFLCNGTSNYRLYKKVGGSWTNVSGNVGTPAANDIMTLRASGSTIIIEKNGTVLGTYTSTDLQTATKVGISITGTGSVDTFQVWEGDPAIPVVDQVGPTVGPTGGGTEVTILGNNFTGATDVKFGSLSATSFTVVSDTYIRATTPAHSAALVHVIVTNPDGDNVLETDDQFTFATPSPLVSSITPSHGAPAGGTSVVLTGAYFTGATSVKFGTTEATSFTVDNDGQITATTPAHAAGVTPVIVTTPYGTNG